MLMKYFLSTITKNKISETALISEKAIIVGPTFIDDNSVIGDYSMVRESQIGQDCLIGSYAEVARSYVGNNVLLHRNYIGDSVLNNDVMFGAQAVTGNLRFSGEKISSLVNEEKVDTNMNKLGAIIGNLSKIGVNATILPGVKIGKETWISPGEVVRYDVDDKTYLANGDEKINLKI